MKYIDLFRLEDCLSSNLASTTYVEVEKETTYAKAFAVEGFYKNKKAKGLYIVVYCEDEAEEIYYLNAIKFWEDGAIWGKFQILQTITQNGDYRLIIDVNEN